MEWQTESYNHLTDLRLAFSIRTVNLEDILREVQTDSPNFHGSPSLDCDEAYRLPQEPGWVHFIRSHPLSIRELFANIRCSVQIECEP